LRIWIWTFVSSLIIKFPSIYMWNSTSSYKYGLLGNTGLWYFISHIGHRQRKLLVLDCFCYYLLPLRAETPPVWNIFTVPSSKSCDTMFSLKMLNTLCVTVGKMLHRCWRKCLVHNTWLEAEILQLPLDFSNYFQGIT
jgi:hypothetical protein